MTTTERVPKWIVELASDWYDGSDSMLYAIASTGGLTLGSIRRWSHDLGRTMTDEEQLVSLFDELGCELRHCIKLCQRHGDSEHAIDLKKLIKAEQWAETAKEKLRKRFGLDREDQ